MTATARRLTALFTLACFLLPANGAVADGEYWSIADFPSEQAPAFEDYSTRWPVPYELFTVDLQSHPDAARFADALEAAIGRGPDFATYYVVVQSGCGSGCTALAVADVDTGKVFVGPVAEHGFEYQASSRLLIVNPPSELQVGFLDESDLKVKVPLSIFPKYYQFTDEAFQLVWCWRPDTDGDGDTVC